MHVCIRNSYFSTLKYLWLWGCVCAAAEAASCWEVRASTVQIHCWFHSVPAFLHGQNEGPDISRLRPDLQQQWDDSKNVHFGKTQIYPFSSKKAHWKCPHGPASHPHSWVAIVSNRSSGTNCPICSGRQVSKSTSLATKAPGVAKDWDFEANKLTPDDYTTGSQACVHWKCQTCGQGWTAPVRRRAGSASRQGSGCPHCYSLRHGHKADGSRQTHSVLADSGHPVMNDWDADVNLKLGLDPAKIKLRSNKQVHWVCRKCPLGHLHRWAATPSDRTAYNTGCPYCSSRQVCRCNSLRTIIPEVAKDWDYAKNEGTPDDYPAFAHLKVWWKSAARGSWQQSIVRRSAAYHKRQMQSGFRSQH